MIERKTPEQILAMRRSGLAVAAGLQVMQDAAAPGVTTGELDALAAEVLASLGAKSSFLNYGAEYGVGFPGVACISVNEEVVHGIPGDRELREGDLVSCDFGAILDGWHGDAARSFIVGKGQPEHEQLVADTYEALWTGIAAARAGSRVGAISSAIQGFVKSRDANYGIVREYTGHGIGREMHMEPDVPNYGRRMSGPRLEVGTAIAIEPMLVLGTHQVALADDDWTVITRDRKWGAHWEHTVALTEKGVWVLTAEDGGEAELNRLGAPFGPLGD